jgi:hypothetical protein
VFPLQRRCRHDYDEASKERSPPAHNLPTTTSPIHRPNSSGKVSSSPRTLKDSLGQFHVLTSARRYDTTDEQSSGVHEAPFVSGDNTHPGPRSRSTSSADEDHGRSRTGSSSEPETADRPNFVGHLNPEGIFIAATRHGASKASRYDDSMGFWLPRKDLRRTEDEGRLPSNCRLDLSSSKNPNDTTASSQAPRNRRIRVLPDPQSFNSLRAIYFKDIHPIFPILPPDLVSEMTEAGELSIAETILMQSLCLTVAMNVAARPFLRIQGRRDILAPNEFAARLSQALVAGLETAGTIDRMTSVRVFTILSLFSQLSTDHHTCAEYCARAVSYVHTMHLHLETAHVRKDDVMVTQVFLCVWALDRLNAAFNSRPVLIHERDIGRNIQASIVQQEGCFRAFLVICGLLEEVTGLYRPTHMSRASNDNFVLPPFEDLVNNADAVRCYPHLLGQFSQLRRLRKGPMDTYG